ncbi:D-methionine transport system substrate-binding protein [Virgibacillus halotolerans]|uniref:MetQ/NlpA family ABC transporter substrate-binding protein n=1 Tax=Virgibacillus halotolerans TaxID=1071053 RepID=UPI00195F6C07|nr:MetQ/NlpA family ABC transporter substrate-binding protein [Virgibacillus halotolerans]MBM7600653.1 D-methionine transport system substrate-binding protein [Virgibacillus halotolerans]
MKKIAAYVSILFVLILAACGGSNTDENSDEKEIKIGASSTPHAEILEEAKPLLEAEGITLDIKKYQDYVFPNDDLESGELDANFFQHIPYLETTIEDTGYDLDYIDGIHIEPMGIYSKDIASIDDIKDGTEVILSRSVADHGRVLALFEKEGLIKLDKDVDKVSATVKDIVDNPKNLTFSADVDAATLPELYSKEDNVLVAINTNYAIDADLNPLEDALIIEGDESPYVNVIAVRSEDKDNEALNTLVDVLHSDEIQQFIEETYDGAIVPVGGND